MERRSERKAAVALAACMAGTTAWSGAIATHDAPKADVQTSHRMRSIDQTLNGRKFIKEARVQPEQARALAVKAFAGAIQFEKLQRNADGRGLRYCNARGEAHEVDIDADDGRTLRNVPTRRFANRPG